MRALNLPESTLLSLMCIAGNSPAVARNALRFRGVLVMADGLGLAKDVGEANVIYEVIK